MKDRIREAIFSSIGHSAVEGALVLDLFAGTGLLTLESLSRGADGGIAVERNSRLAAQLRQHGRTLAISDQLIVITADAFHWFGRWEPDRTRPWLVFVCPPYALFQDQPQALLQLIESAVEQAPPGSTLVVESDDRFDQTRLPAADQWTFRTYRPTIVARRVT
jgi:16S rRNA (guanine966-N2)-methyltransferase